MKIVNVKKQHVKKQIVTSFFCLAVLTASQAQSAIVQFSINGEITDAYSNPFGLSTGDLISATGVFDDSSISAAGVSYVDFSLSYNNMVIEVGSVNYTDELDLLGGASLYFSDGILDGMDYEAISGSFDSWGYFGQVDYYGVALEDFTGTGIAGNWILDSYQVTAVPVPAAVWLFASGMLLL
ncbi:hypothetical protein MNBD_GAMMA10-3057, partial [hydrothermal vent metagenome]